MILDKTASHVVETNISPTMTKAITLPVAGVKGVVIYVATGPFYTASKADLKAVADALEIKR